MNSQEIIFKSTVIIGFPFVMLSFILLCPMVLLQKIMEKD